jgi:hypothetical protein
MKTSGVAITGPAERPGNWIPEFVTFTSATTPTISVSAEPLRILRPTGLTPLAQLRRNVSLTTATSGAPGRSSGVNVRPCRTATRSTSKNCGVTYMKLAIGQ